MPDLDWRISQELAVAQAMRDGLQILDEIHDKIKKAIEDGDWRSANRLLEESIKTESRMAALMRRSRRAGYRGLRVNNA